MYIGIASGVPLKLNQEQQEQQKQHPKIRTKHDNIILPKEGCTV